MHIWYLVSPMSVVASQKQPWVGPAAAQTDRKCLRLEVSLVFHRSQCVGVQGVARSL